MPASRTIVYVVACGAAALAVFAGSTIFHVQDKLAERFAPQKVFDSARLAALAVEITPPVIIPHVDASSTQSAQSTLPDAHSNEAESGPAESKTAASHAYSSVTLGKARAIAFSSISHAHKKHSANTKKHLTKKITQRRHKGTSRLITRNAPLINPENAPGTQ